MTVDLSSLRGVVEKSDGWRPLTPTDFTVDSCLVLSFDQSFMSSGYVEIFVEDGTINVGRTETIKPPKETENLAGFEQDYARAAYLEERAFDLIRMAPVHEHVLILHEMPAVSQARTRVKINPIPSRMGGQAIRSAVRRVEAVYAVEFPPVKMMQAQKAKRITCGNAKADKKEAHSALMLLGWVNGLERLTNEHLRDAGMNGLVAAMEMSP